MFSQDKEKKIQESIIFLESLLLSNHFSRSLWRDLIWNALEKIIISLIIQRIRYSGGVNEYGECHGMGSLILSYKTSPAPAPVGPFASQIHREHD